MKICPSCGSELHDNAVICVKCGFSVPENKIEQSEKSVLPSCSNQKESIRRMGLGIILSLVLFFGGDILMRFSDFIRNPDIHDIFIIICTIFRSLLKPASLLILILSIVSVVKAKKRK